MAMDLVALIPVNNEDAVLQQNALGFQPLRDAYSLTELAKNLTSGAEPGAEAAIANAGETAIPDICAHVQYLRTRLSDGAALDMSDEAVRAWVGVMALIAVSELRDGFSLTIQKISLNGDSNEYMKKVYRDALLREHLLDEDNCVSVLQVNGNPVAMLEPKDNQSQLPWRCFCIPFSTIDDPANCMFPVKWFASGGMDPTTHRRIAHRWRNVLGKDNSTNLPYLNRTDRLTFVEWLDALRKSGRIDYPAAVSQVIRDLNTDLTNSEGELLDLFSTFNNPANRPANLTAWRGALACIALGKMRGYNIEKELYRAAPGGDPYREVLLGDEQEWLVIKVNGARIGVLDRNLLIRPFCCVAEPLDHVPWFQDGEWVEISGPQVSNGEMDKSERRKLAYWYAQIAEKCADTKAAKALNESADLLELNFGRRLECKCEPLKSLATYTMQDGSPVAERFVSILQTLQSVPDFTHPMPPVPEMFTEYLVLTMASLYNVRSRLGMVDGTGIDNSITITDDTDPFNKKTERFLALLPLRSTFTSTFIPGPQGLNLVSLNMKLDGSTIKVTIVLNNDESRVVHQWSYTAEKGQILYYETFPYLALWPYIRSDAWKEYYIAWSQRLECLTPSSIFAVPATDPLLPVSSYEEITTYDGNPQNAWWSLTYDHFPEYIHVQIVDGGLPVEVGAIYTNPPRSYETGQNMCYAAIDFGSSNTIVRLTDGAGTIIEDSPNQPYRVFTNNYVKPLTMCANEVDSFYEQVKSFHQFLWLPFVGQDDRGFLFWEADTTRRTDRLPTVVEMYEGASKVNNRAPRFGQFLHSNCNVMSHFLAEQMKTNTTIEAIGIRSNIKMRRGGNKFDGILAIQMILLECALAATERSASLSFAVSYPDQRMWRDLNQLWTPAANNARRVCSSIIFNGTVNLKVTELMASKSFAHRFAGGVIPTAGYCILDIGGGTSDISLWRSVGGGVNAKAEMFGGLSLKYAGNQITAESVFSFYRRIVGSLNSNVEQFRMLWELKDAPRAIIEYEEKMEAGFQNLMRLNLSMQANLEKLHNQVPLLATTIVSDCRFSQAAMLGDEVLEPFTALMRFKISNVFYVIARLIALTGACDLSPNGSTYYVSLAGNGAAALDACGDEMPDYLAWLMQNVIGTQRRFGIQNLPTYRKTEVVNGMCQLLADRLNPDAGQQAAAFGALPAGVNQLAFADIEDSALFTEMFNSYCFYVEYIIGAQKQFFAVGDHFSGEGVEGPDYGSIYDMLTMQDPANPWTCYPWDPNFWNNPTFHPVNYSIYADKMNWILDEVYKEVDLATTPKRMIADIAAIKMADYILLVHKYK